MNQYPMMLYKGNQANYVHTIVDDEHEEQAALQAGYVEYGDLQAPEPDFAQAIGAGASAGHVGGWPTHEVDMDSFVPIEQFDALGERIVELEDQVVTLQLDSNALREQVAAYENQRTDELPQAASDTAGTGTGQPDYIAWTNAQLHEAITAAGKTFNQRDTKAELIATLTGEK